MLRLLGSGNRRKARGSFGKGKSEEVSQRGGSGLEKGVESASTDIRVGGSCWGGGVRTLSGRKGALKALGTKPRDLGSLKAVSIDTIIANFRSLALSGRQMISQDLNTVYALT